MCKHRAERAANEVKRLAGERRNEGRSILTQHADMVLEEGIRAGDGKAAMPKRKHLARIERAAPQTPVSPAGGMTNAVSIRR